jgi:uncharacterized membrane protein HdeD (DUF308 family)
MLEMKIEIKNNSKSSLFMAIIFLILGALIMSNPNLVIAIIAYIIGICLIAFGIYSSIKNYLDTKANSNTSSTNLIIGIVSIIVGVIFIFLANAIGIAVQYLVGAWILFKGIERLINTLQSNKKDNNYIVQLVVAILLIAAGLYNILKANIGLSIVGLIMMIYAILEIVGYLTNRNSNNANDDANTFKETAEKIKDAVLIEDSAKDEDNDKHDDHKKDKKKKKK